MNKNDQSGVLNQPNRIPKPKIPSPIPCLWGKKCNQGLAGPGNVFPRHHGTQVKSRWVPCLFLTDFDADVEKQGRKTDHLLLCPLPESLQSFCISSNKTVSRKGKPGQTTWLAEQKARYPRSSQWVTLLHWGTLMNGKCQKSGAGSHLRESQLHLSIPRERHSILAQCLVSWIEFGSHLTSLVPCRQRCSLCRKEFLGSWNLRTGENLKIYLDWDLRSLDE